MAKTDTVAKVVVVLESDDPEIDGTRFDHFIMVGIPSDVDDMLMGFERVDVADPTCYNMVHMLAELVSHLGRMPAEPSKK